MLHLRDFTVFISYFSLLIFHSSHGVKIIGGKEVQPHSLPFMALLECSKPSCGGVLIDRNWVLTAAHCTCINKVLLGVHYIKSNRSDQFRQVRKVTKEVRHPWFEAKYGINDLMLLKLDKPVKPTKGVKPYYDLCQTLDPAAGSICLVAGWGTIRNNSNEMSNVLRSVKVTVIDRAKCNSPVVTSSMICAGSDGRNPADTCTGDSGGPLLCNDVLVGITSFKNYCGMIEKPGVYSFLTEHQVKWIKHTIENV